MEAASNNMPIQSPLINVMVSAVRKASRGLMRDFGEVDHLQISRKGPSDFVTETDLRTEKLLKAELHKSRPKFGFLLEESGEFPSEESEFRWVVDPLDGTTNFIHAIPYFCISIGVEKITDKGSEIIAGVIYDPIHDELFMAEKDKGAYLNQRRLRVSPRRSDFYFVTGTSRSSSPYAGASAKLNQHVTTLDGVFRRSGSAALDLAYVAAARYDACWFPNLKKWDMAAGIILVKEAGGIISPLGHAQDAYQDGAILAASPESHPLLIVGQS